MSLKSQQSKNKSQSAEIKLTIFDHSLSEVLAAIVEKQEIDGIDVLQKIKDPDFRFATNDHPELSLFVSNALSAVAENSKGPTITANELSIATRVQNADEFAKSMLSIVRDIQQEEKISSFRSMVNALNKNEIPTYRGGEWHLSTYQNLHKRWKSLGLSLEPSNC